MAMPRADAFEKVALCQWDTDTIVPVTAEMGHQQGKGEILNITTSTLPQPVRQNIPRSSTWTGRARYVGLPYTMHTLQAELRTLTGHAGKNSQQAGDLRGFHSRPRRRMHSSIDISTIPLQMANMPRPTHWQGFKHVSSDCFTGTGNGKYIH
jgi:hypothetical protein